MIDRTKKLQARFYETPSGTEPVRAWLKDLPDEDRKVVGKDIAKVEFGWPIGMPYCRAMGRGLWEVRSELQHGRIARVFFCIAKGDAVLLHAFIKKTRQTPQADLDLARKRMKEIAYD
ncbi:MAG: type II toxin-antitoxin system RelE/ParE family toxin [Proteobacteria bacterium]|nr:type II toxin-antitoxin system RelE/ParE family toxin [Pseudomonadota bacterium]